MANQIPVPDISFTKPSKSVGISDKLDKTIVKFTGIGMIVFVIVLVLVLILNISIVGNHEQVKKNISTTQQQLNSLSKEEARYLVFVKKIKLLSGISEDRKIRKQALDFLNTLVPSEDVMKRITLDQEKKTIAFSVEMPDVFALSRFLTKLSSSEIKDKPFILITEDVLRSPDGTYVLNANLLFDTNSAKQSNKGAPSNAAQLTE